MRVEVPVVLFTSDLRPVPIRKAMHAGARGLVLKSDGVQSLLDTLKDVHELGHGFSSDLAHVLMTDPDLAPELARREVEALSLLASGIPRKIVHKYMQPPVSQHTVDTYFKRIADRYANVGRALNSAFHADTRLPETATLTFQTGYPEPGTVLRLTLPSPVLNEPMRASLSPH